MIQTPNSNRKPPINEQIANLILKVIMTGGIAGGGLGAFWSLFKNSDIPKAIASAAIGLGISYAAKMLTPVHKGNERRLAKTGEAIDSGIDQMLKYLTDKAQGGTPEDRYLACQALECQTFKSEGMIQHNGIFTPLLTEVFVSLGIDSTATMAGFKALSTQGSSTEGLSPEDLRDDLDVWTFLSHAHRNSTFRQLAILAWGGSGKTTLLKHIAYCYGSRQAPRSAPNLIPFLLILRKHRHTIAQDIPPTLPEVITIHHIPNLPAASDFQMPAKWAQEVLQRGRAIVMFDGFDEVPHEHRPKVARWINQQMRRYSQSVFILTSRPKAYTEQHDKIQHPANRLEFSARLWVKDFSANQRRDFVEKWYLCQERYANGGRDTPDVRHMAMQSATSLLDQIEARDELKALAKNPLLLNMIVTFHRRNPGTDVPQRRVELYQEICQLQLKNRPNARQLDTLLTQCEAQTILQQIALEMMKQRWERIQRAALLKGLQKILTQRGEAIDPAEFLEQVVQISELLVQQEDEYEFAHLSFQEYLAATHIIQTHQEQLLYTYLEDEKWKPTILLYAAQMMNPTTLIQEAVNRGATDLAYQCLQELPKTKRMSCVLTDQLTILQQTVQTSRYQILENYLKNGQWKDADDETYRLMITAVGKEEGQLFDPDELLSFPYEDLLAIDGLWVKYSDDKFGFSVQQDIYLDCGGAPDGKYHEKAFKKFGDRVGWRDMDSWQLQCQFNLSSPRGHLPFCIWGRLLFRGWSLLSHRAL